jgi:hypothetical protein
MEMSKEVLSAVSQSFELATYSTPELRGLFNDWIGEIEREILDFIKNRGKVDPDEIAGHFRLERGSVIFMLGKLARERKIKMQAFGTEG